jgi:hypothetical protein
MSEAELRAELRRLDPTVPWAHHFALGHGIETITPENRQFYDKARGLKKLGKLVLDLVPYHTKRGALAGARVLDLASAEGGHSIALAAQGAEVLGIEGRQLYVERARFAASALGIDNVRFEQGDVRTIDAGRLGKFDIVLFFGILHHLGQDDFAHMLETLCRLTGDALFLYTHVSTPEAIQRFRLEGPVRTRQDHEGFLFREHADGASAEERQRQVRASLDNTFSFWATPESLSKALAAVGFVSVCNLLTPHIHGWVDAQCRWIAVARA